VLAVVRVCHIFGKGLSTSLTRTIKQLPTDFSSIFMRPGPEQFSVLSALFSGSASHLQGDFFPKGHAKQCLPGIGFKVCTITNVGS